MPAAASRTHVGTIDSGAFTWALMMSIALRKPASCGMSFTKSNFVSSGQLSKLCSFTFGKPPASRRARSVFAKS